jgi:uncharacterized membrane protein YgdD (TMEM256/DUF423 family)
MRDTFGSACATAAPAALATIPAQSFKALRRFMMVRSVAVFIVVPFVSSSASYLMVLAGCARSLGICVCDGSLMRRSSASGPLPNCSQYQTAKGLSFGH